MIRTGDYYLGAPSANRAGTGCPGAPVRVGAPPMRFKSPDVDGASVYTLSDQRCFTSETARWLAAERENSLGSRWAVWTEEVNEPRSKEDYLLKAHPGGFHGCQPLGEHRGRRSGARTHVGTDHQAAQEACGAGWFPGAEVAGHAVHPGGDRLHIESGGSEAPRLNSSGFQEKVADGASTEGITAPTCPQSGAGGDAGRVASGLRAVSATRWLAATRFPALPSATEPARGASRRSTGSRSDRIQCRPDDHHSCGVAGR